MRECHDLRNRRGFHQRASKIAVSSQPSVFSQRGKSDDGFCGPAGGGVSDVGFFADITDDDPAASGSVFDLTFDAATNLPGDFNGNGIVDAADYTVFQDNFGSDYFLNGNGDEDGDSDGIVDQADYNLWISHFGETAQLFNASAAIPEPNTLRLAFIFAIAVIARCHRR
jgi:hypothetical protein